LGLRRRAMSVSCTRVRGRWAEASLGPIWDMGTSSVRVAAAVRSGSVEIRRIIGKTIFIVLVGQNNMNGRSG